MDRRLTLTGQPSSFTIPMKNSKLYLLLACVVLLGGCGKDDPKEDDTPDIMKSSAKVYKDRSIYSDAMNMSISYSIWLPPSYDENKTYPVLYLLHGYEFFETQIANAHNGWFTQASLNSNATKYIWGGGELFIIVTPNGQNSFYMDDYDDRHLKYGTFFEDEFIPFIEKEYHGNGKRAIAGLSMGGFGTLYHCLTHPEKFTYAYACSPAAWGLEGVVKSCDKSKVPGITLETGTEDMTVSLNTVTSFSDVLKENGIDHELITRSGGHTWQFWEACLPKILKKVGESFK